MGYKVYGKLIASFHKSTGKMPGLIDRTLEIYETKTGLKACIWNCSFKGWKGTWHRPITQEFYKGLKNNEVNIYHLKDLYRF